MGQLKSSMDNSPVRFIDHTLLKADATSAEIALLCEDAVEHGFASVCIAPCFVPQARELLYGSDVALCTVVGFPLGNQTTETKVFESRQAVDSGADEIDMVIALGAAREGDYDAVLHDIQSVVTASGAAVVKVIIECCLFNADTRRTLAEVVAASGADFVKTSTGFSSSGATLEDVALLADAVSGRVGVKAAGGIRDLASCLAMIEAGADRIGTSAGVAIAKAWQAGLETAG